MPLTIGTGVITRNELKHFYTAFMDVGKLGDKELDDLTTKSFNTLTSVSYFLILQELVAIEHCGLCSFIKKSFFVRFIHDSFGF